MITRVVRRCARAVFGYAKRTRAYPRHVRTALTTILVLACYAVRYALFGGTGVMSYTLAFPAIIVASVMFSRGAGIYATILSAALALLVTSDATRIVDMAHVEPVQVIIFLLVGCFTAVVVEALQDSLAETDAARAEAEEARKARDLLLVELGHRTKNDIARIKALLTMQSAGAPPDVANALLTAAERINVIARVHDRLHMTDTSVVVDSRVFLHGLVSDLARILDGSPVRIVLHAESHALPPAQMGALGLIANEVITNALKHAYPDGRSGTITATFQRQGPNYVLTISDDGVGHPGHESSGLGGRIIRALAAQLEGVIEIRANQRGTTCILRFPVQCSERVPNVEPVAVRQEPAVQTAVAC